MPFIERPFRLTAEGVDWDDIQGKPNQFPPEAHASTHGANGSDPVTVDWNTQIANKPTSFPPESHVHSAADITSGRFGLSRLPDGPSGKVLMGQGEGNDPIWGEVSGGGPHASTHAWNGSDPVTIDWNTQIANKPTSFPPEPHASTHAAGGSDALSPSAIGALALAGGTMQGILVAQNNTDYTTPQVRNIIISTEDPSGGAAGDVWLKYVE